MEILIKGMEMPDSCFLCRFCRRQEYGEYVGEDTAWSCVASKKRITDGQDLIATFKHPGCPLVEAAEAQNAVSRQAIDARRYTFGNDEFSLEAAYHDCKLVFDGITDDDSFQEADTGLILYYANEIIYALQEALEGKDTNVQTNDCISRKDAIDALWGEREKVDSYMDLCLKKGLFALRSGTKAERNRIEEDIEIITRLPSAQPTLCGYDINHLMLIAVVLRKENLPPERVTEALTDIGRIVSIVRNEFEESLRKAVEQCKDGGVSRNE